VIFAPSYARAAGKGSARQSFDAHGRAGPIARVVQVSKKSTAAPRENPDYTPRATSSRTTYILGGIAVVVIAAVIGVVVWLNNRDYPPADQQVLAENATFTLGPENAPVVLDVFEDFHCPHCKTFAAESDDALLAAAQAGRAQVRYHMLHFLDGESSSGSFSSRGSGAMLCAAGEDDRVLATLHGSIFAQSDADPDDAALAGLAEQAGASEAARACIAAGEKVDEARARADASQEQLSNVHRGRAQTPTVLRDGELVEKISGSHWLEPVLQPTTGK